MKGKVVLIGAGPGDLGLMTIKGLEEMKNADVVVYDRLVGEDILKFIPENAEKIDAGKKASEHKIPQNEINKILLEKALSGKKVIRLKGGDCFLFGRGGEEIELLKENNVEFEVVPGITSALAVPAYAGIPVTHRDFASSVHIIAGHKKNNEPLDVDFKSCVKCGGTLVFLMGSANIKYISESLILNGMPKDMPCGVIENGTYPNQRKIISTISKITKVCEDEKIESPAVIIVGKVCGLSSDFDWYSRLPLKGKRVVVTRPEDRAESLSGKLRKMGAYVIEYPCIETISLLDDSLVYDILEKIKLYDYIAFTSPAGVKYVFDSFFERNIDGRVFFGKKIAVIGKATGDELKKYGLFYDIIPENHDGKSLGILLGRIAEGKKVLLLRAKEGGADITEEFQKAKVLFDDTAVYYTKYINNDGDVLKNKILNGEVDYVTFTSSSIVKAFTNCVKQGYDKFTGVCIGEKTNSEAIKYGINTIVSKRADIDDMVSVIVSEVRKCQKVL